MTSLVGRPRKKKFYVGKEEISENGRLRNPFLSMSMLSSS
jgi:hypothetical protein